MIAFMAQYGYTILALLLLATFYVMTHKYVEGPPTAEENQVILDSLKHRQSFLLNTTKSRWGEE